MTRCTRKGCGAEYNEPSDGPCTFHPGTPVFHEGLKSWSCCSDVNKPVLDFDEFMKFSGCAQTEHHTHDAPLPDPVKATSTVDANVKVSHTEDGKEVYTNSSTFPKPPTIPAATAPKPTATPDIVPEEEDDLEITVEIGTVCKRKSCGTAFQSDEENRLGGGPGTVCTYHSHPPYFREGSKGYLCCKRRVLEFDEFLKITGCKTGRHLFAPKVDKSAPAKEEIITCRIDHYQTVDKVYVSIFAKKADKERSSIVLQDNQVSVDIVLPDSKRFVKTLHLFGPIDPSASKYTYFGTKVELTLQKQDGRSWTILEKTDQDLGGISLTFGVGGRTGTTGAKEAINDDVNNLKI